MATEVAQLFASLGIRANAGEWKAAGNFISRIGAALDKNEGKLKKAQGLFGGVESGIKSVGLAVAGYFGARAAKGALIDFNSTVEDTRNQIAGMMALATHTDLQDNFAQADKTLESLRARAAKLPGTTAEYAKMLGMITQPVLDAKLGMQDLEDITVGAVVAAKALGVESEVAARDIDQAIRGQFKSVDQLTGKLLGSMGFKGEAGRAKFNAMSAEKRAETLKQALTQKQIVQLAEAQGNTFSGVMSTLQDSLQQFFGKVGLPLFKAITEQVKSWVQWFEDNKEAVDEFASSVAGVLSTAFGVLKTAIGVIVDILSVIFSNSTLLRATLIALGVVLTTFAVQAAAAWIAGFAPLIGIIAVVTAVVLVVMDLINAIVDGKGVIATVLRWIANAFKAMGRSIINAFRAVGNFFKGIAQTIKAAFVAVIDWITDKIDWAWSQVKKIAGYVRHPGRIVDDALDFFTGDDDSGSPPTAQMTSTASRVVTPSGGAPPVVYVDAPTTVKVEGNMPPGWIETKIDKQIRTDKERTARDIDAALGGADED
jgi:VIT1/CCC1 family predicted Fe2+/Mn2+ transporter